MHSKDKKSLQERPLKSPGREYAAGACGCVPNSSGEGCEELGGWSHVCTVQAMRSRGNPGSTLDSTRGLPTRGLPAPPPSAPSVPMKPRAWTLCCRCERTTLEALWGAPKSAHRDHRPGNTDFKTLPSCTAAGYQSMNPFRKLNFKDKYIRPGRLAVAVC